MGRSVRSTFGAVIQTARKARGWSQSELGRRAELPQSVVAAVEAGMGARVDSLERICHALDGQLILDARLPFSGDPRRQGDIAHARCVGSVRRLLEVASHACVSEQEFTDGPWRGWIDLVAYDPLRHRIVVAEIKTELRDAGALERQVER